MEWLEKKQRNGEIEFTLLGLENEDDIKYVVGLIEDKTGLKPTERLIDVSYMCYVYETQYGIFSIYLQDYWGLYLSVDSGDSADYCRSILKQL